ncbi:MAG: sulfotransferase domain-containing protein [Candidatus Omnitrophica bacterium]|nr:sulfotransferase domain-containing protein [Candidatus Omnitrophota bacterium]
MDKTVLEQVVLEEFDYSFDRLIVVDGITRSGKFWLTNMLMYFQNLEYAHHFRIMDLFIYMNKTSKLSDNAAVSLLQHEARMHMWEVALGRNINMRQLDSSCVCKGPKADIYKKRISKECGQNISIEDVFKGDNYFVFVGHDWLTNSSLCFKAYPKIKIIRMERNPIDLVYAWYKKGLGKEENHDCRLKNKSGPRPWFTYDWQVEFSRLCEIDKIIHSIYSLDLLTKRSLESLEPDLKSKIFFTSYELVAIEAKKEASKLCQFLNTRQMDDIEEFYSQDYFKTRDRGAILGSRKGKLELIKSLASDKALSLLLKLDQDYKNTGLDLS